MNLENKLESHGIRPTASRLLILRVLSEADHPMSGQEIEDALETVDRSTITRSMSLFLEKDIIHLIEDGTGSAKYELCISDNNHNHSHHHDDMHVHFHCRRCGKTFCFQSIEIPEVPIPDGFQPETANYLLTGLCPSCIEK